MDLDDGPDFSVPDGSMQQIRSPSKEVFEAKDLVKKLEQDRRVRGQHFKELRSREIARQFKHN